MFIPERDVNQMMLFLVVAGALAGGAVVLLATKFAGMW